VGESLWVDVGGVSVRVIGTRFRVSTGGDGVVSVLVNHGRVRVTDAKGEVREVTNGEILRLDDQDARLSAAADGQQQRLDSELDGAPDDEDVADDAGKKVPAKVRRPPAPVKPPAPPAEPVVVGQSNPLRTDAWRSQIMGGKVESARAALAARLRGVAAAGRVSPQARQRQRGRERLPGCDQWG
jgi:hypothetical protein